MFVLGYAVLKSDLSVGAVVTVIALLGNAYLPIAIFNVEYVDYKLNKVTVKKYINFLDLKDDEQLSIGKLLNKIDGNISFNNVSYSYSDKKDLIKNLSLKIKKNSSVAVS